MCVEHDIHLGSEQTAKSCRSHRRGKAMCSPSAAPETALEVLGYRDRGGGGCLPISSQTLGLGGLLLPLLRAVTGLETRGLEFLPSRPCQQPGRQTVFSVKVVRDLGFPCTQGEQRYRSHCVCLTMMPHPQGVGDCDLGKVLFHSPQLLEVGRICGLRLGLPGPNGQMWTSVAPGIYKPQCLMGTPQRT